jgi:hypothetical protein
MSRILITANWRTGSNLLVSIFTDRGYYEFNEWYSLTGIYITKNLPGLPHEVSILDTSNKYLENLVTQLSNVTLKLNMMFFELPNQKVLDLFDTKILLYRSNFYKMILSRYVAEHRLHWGSIDINEIQPLYHERIDPVKFLDFINQDLTIHENYIKKYDSSNIDYVVNYEDDLLPYIKHNPSKMIPSNNYFIQNESELKNLVSQYQSRIERIVDFFREQKMNKNKIQFSEYIKFILNK